MTKLPGDSETLDRERARLEEERVRLEEELAHLREDMQQEVDIEPDEGDPVFFEREKSAALMAVLERRLQDTNHALRALEKGEYGICERCNNPIEPERLEVKPDATMCLNCQREVEAVNRRNRVRRTVDRW
ncbi:MAG: TraR/DksA C4-type zinc finger protein [Caldilineaceae bacterium]|nr:TraR/DksA C4-type zinc finger protein [Caldilineaceae bacterium]